MYLRTARLDLNDYNNDSEDGLHITSMAGTWMSVVHGFGGVKVNENGLHINPFTKSLDLATIYDILHESDTEDQYICIQN